MLTVGTASAGILRLVTSASEIRSRMEMFRWDLEHNPNTTSTTQPAGEAGEARGKLVTTFRHELSWRIRDEPTRQSTVDLIDLADTLRATIRRIRTSFTSVVDASDSVVKAIRTVLDRQ